MRFLVAGIGDGLSTYFEVNPGMVVDAMLAADAFGRQRRAVLEGEAHLPAVAP